MSATIVQSTKKIVSGVASTTLAFPSALTGGNAAIVSVASFRVGGATVNAPTSINGNTFSAAIASLAMNADTALRTFIDDNVAAGAETVGVAFPSGSGDLTITVAEFSGLAASPVDGTNTGTGSGTGPVTGSVTPTTANTLLWGVVSHDSGSNLTITENTGGGWTLVQENEGGSANMPIGVQYRDVSSIAAYTASWTLGGSAGWACFIVAFKEAAASPTLTQEGCRWRNDDGSETTATWKAAQDTGATIVKGNGARLRVIVDATNDPAAGQYQLEYRKVGAGSWNKVE